MDLQAEYKAGLTTPQPRSSMHTNYMHNYLRKYLEHPCFIQLRLGKRKGKFVLVFN